MATASELILASQIEALRQNAEIHGWYFELLDPATFVLGLTAKDNSDFALLVRCNDFPTRPPAWHWHNRTTKAVDAQDDTPTGGSFFHGAGVICAPWNRLAYTQEDSRGPHSDWTIGNWLSTPQTGGTRTLAAMAERIAHEFKVSYQGRLR